MSNNELSSTTTVSASAPTSSKLDTKVSLSCHNSQTTLAFQSNAALTSFQSALHSPPFVRPAPASTVVPASSNLDSSSLSSRPALTSPVCRHDLSPLPIPATSAVLSPPVTPSHVTLPRSPNSASPPGGNHFSKGTPYSPRVEVEEQEIENSGSSSDVEIFLSSLGLENAAPSMFAMTVAGSEEVVPSMGRAEQTESRCAGKGTSPQIPPAPLQQTIPLPEVMPDCDTQSATPQSTSPTLSPSRSGTILHEACGDVETGSNATASGLPTLDSLRDCIDIDSQQKTPNVYINGLPPHFPEEQLYALAAPFGPVRSVRTFTRHVKDSESGYGFVLFETIESAERCIIALRRYRNLHPTFSKQVHKIPGITYTQILPPSPHSEEALSEKWDQQDAKDGSASFKEKMEGLHDPTSTNLYMEGLPLSIDEATLAALVSPHRISSSRFFQTRLSNPPRIIAFVRLETRVGAEEIIERLHGRMVRGWNDTGSRISVRFADTAEQRELRRTERANKEGDPSPARLTIAQAALLNMRGQDLRQRQSPILPSHQSLPDRLSRLRAENALYPEFSPTVHLSPSGLTVDYSLSSNAAYTSPAIRASNSYPHRMNSQQPDLVRNANPAVLSLLDSLRGSHSYSGDYVGHDIDIQYNIGPQVPHRTNRISEDFGYPAQKYPLRNGYTPTEEYIMRAHAESASQRRRPAPLDLYRRRKESDAATTIGMGVRGYRAQASTITLPQKVFTPSAPLDPAADDFQITAAVTSELRSRAQQLEAHQNDILRHGSSVQPSHGASRVVRDPIQTKQSKQPSAHLQQSLQSVEAYPVGHTRSSTLPQRSTVNQHQRHFQHNSMSATSTGSMAQDTISAILSNMNQTASLPTSRANASSNDATDDNATNERKETFKLKNSNRLPYDNIKGPVQLEYRNSRLVRDSTTSNDTEQSSPSLNSPALTYSSQTPSTLSPATPFFGSFASQSDGFEPAAPEVKRVKAS